MRFVSGLRMVVSAGIGPRTYRTYPVRAGETIKDIISKRDITRAEVDALNPEVNLDKLTRMPPNPDAFRLRQSV